VRVWQPFLFLLIVSLQQLAGPACAASLSIDRSDTKTAILEGTIDSGDFEKLQNFLGANKDVVRIYLASPGGNLGEALRMGLLVRRLNLSTTVPNRVLTHQALEQVSTRHGLEHPETNYLCASACFFIFVAGVHRNADTNGIPLLGIHSPFVSSQKLREIGTDQASEIKNTARSEIEAYLKIMNVPSRYVLDMYSASKKLRWIRDDEFNSDFRDE
jgi:hypothetical protein